MLHRFQQTVGACLLVGGALALCLGASGCAGARANATNSQAARDGGAASAPAPGRTTDSGSRMLGFGDPVGGITVETPPVQGGSTDAPLPPPLPSGAGTGTPGSPPPPLMPDRRSPPRPAAPSWPPQAPAQAPAPADGGTPEDSAGLGAPPAPEIRRHGR